ncbi:hypothetical protein HDV06_000812 [Boothiomyces sp. JEL0866]|nr:hypothetical protein HDV06_000812 [Boothiomyces sp. JEL0866]
MPDVKCDICGKVEWREYKLTRSPDEPLELEKCSCHADIKMLDSELLDLISIQASSVYLVASDRVSANAIRGRTQSEISKTKNYMNEKKKSEILQFEDHCIIMTSNRKTRQEFEIRLDDALVDQFKCYLPIESEQSITEYGTSCTVVDTRGLKRTYKCRRRQPTMETCLKIVNDSVSIFPGMNFYEASETYVTSSEFSSIIDVNALTSYVVAFKEVAYRVGDWEIKRRIYVPSRHVTVEMEYLKNSRPSVEQVTEAVEMLMTQCFSVNSLCPFVSNTYIDVITHSKMPVYDQKVYLESENFFFVKPDGEPCLVVNGGYFWILCRYRDDLEVICFRPKSVKQQFSKFPDTVMCEILPDTSLVFICAITKNGNLLPKDFRFQFRHEMLNRFNDLGIKFRTLHQTYREALESINSLDYPCDGVIGVNKTTFVNIRIKEPTVDLIAHEGYLCSGSNKTSLVRRFKSPDAVQNGYVYECHLVVHDFDNYELQSCFFRPDKLHANSSKVFTSVLHASSINQDMNAFYQRELTDYCFTVREHLYKKAINSRTNGCLIIDVGTGRFQSSSFFSDKTISFLFCDPSLRHMHRLDRRVEEDLTDMGHNDRLNAIKRLNKGQMKIAVFRGRIEDLLTKDAQRYVVETRIPITLSFSASTCYPKLIELINYGALLFFCCYVYDSLIGTGRTIDFMGISMKYVRSNPEDCRGEFRYGKDKIIREYAVRVSDFEGKIVDRTGDLTVSEQLKYFDDAKLYKLIRLFCSR